MKLTKRERELIGTILISMKTINRELCKISESGLELDREREIHIRCSSAMYYHHLFIEPYYEEARKAFPQDLPLFEAMKPTIMNIRDRYKQGGIPMLCFCGTCGEKK